MKMRKIWLVLLVSLLTLSMTACNLFGGNSTGGGQGGSGGGGGDEKTVSGSEKVINVYLIAGQSNAVGYGMDTGRIIENSDDRFTAGFENVLYYGSQERWNGANTDVKFEPVKLGMGVAADRSGAEIGIASAIADGGEMNAIIKCAQGATHLYPDIHYEISLQYGTWTSPTYIKNNNVDLSKNPMIGYMYTRFEDTVKKGLQMLIEDGYTPVIKGVWWMQGEAEMFTLEMASEYKELYETLIYDMRNLLSETTGYDCSSVPFVCGLPKWNTLNSAPPTYQGMVRTSMTTVAKELNNVGCVDCMTLKQHDDWHFDAAGQKYLGENFVKKLQEFEENDESLGGERVSIENEIQLLPTESGLKFKANLTSYNSADGNEYGFIIVPTAKLDEKKINGNFIASLDENFVEYEKIPCEVVVEKIDETCSDIYFVGKLTNVLYENLNTPYTAIAYIKNAYGGYSYSSRCVGESVARLASRELYGDSENKDEIKAILNSAINFLNGVSFENRDEKCNLGLTVEDNVQISISQTASKYYLDVKTSVGADYFVKYTSSNPDVVSVDENGALTPVAAGEATITVECAGVTKQVSVSVASFGQDGVSLDGVISDGEYTGDVIISNSISISAETVGMVKNGNLYLAFKVAHGEWSTRQNDWWRNDNVEFKLNGISHSVVFYDGVPTYSGNITHGNTKTEEIDGKLVTVVEVCVEGVDDLNQIMLCANGNNFGWLPIVHHSVCNAGYIGEEGILVEKPLDLGNGLVLDGAFNESIYTENVKNNAISANGNGADINIIGTLTDNGVVLGVTIKHTKSPDETLIPNGDWFTYMNIEFHFNGKESENDQFMFFANNHQKVAGRAFSYCNTEQTEGGYVSNIEIFISYEAIGVSAGIEKIDFTARGWFETNWCDLLNNTWAATHKVTKDGLSKIN